MGNIILLSVVFRWNDYIIVLCWLLAVFDFVVFCVVCIVSTSVIQLLTCALNQCRRFFNVGFVLRWLYVVNGTLKSKS